MRAESRTHGLNLQPAPLEQPGTALHPSDLPNGPARRHGWCDVMHRKHHRRCQWRFTRLASLARSLTVPAAAGLLLVIAVPLVIMPMPAQAQGNAQSATYRVTFEGKFTASALASGVSVPSGEHFTTLIGAVHNGSVTFWSDGGTASAGIESMAEVGGTSTLKSEINANSNALAIIEQSIASGGTATATVDITLTRDHPLVTLTSMVAPSPDWFVGVSGLSLRNTADDGWQPSLTVNLFPWDAGTEEGTEFSLSNSPTSPQGTIASIKGTGKFSNEPIATLTFDLLAAPEITTTSPILVSENETAVATLTASDDDTPSDQLTWTIPSGTDGGADADHFTLSEGGILAFSAAKNYENPDDTDTDRIYEVTVQVTDADNSVTADLRVTLQNVLELLSAMSGPASVSYGENGALRVATYTASSPEDNGEVVWSLSGDDSGNFSIDDGVLRFHIDPISPNVFLQLPDFEDPADADTDNIYSVTVAASDNAATPTTVTKDVTVTVTNQEEPGTFTLSPTRPRVGTALNATLTDPDGSTSGVARTWERSTGPTTWAAIDGAASSSYTPTAADAGTLPAGHGDLHRWPRRRQERPGRGAVHAAGPPAERALGNRSGARSVPGVRPGSAPLRHGVRRGPDHHADVVRSGVNYASGSQRHPEVQPERGGGVDGARWLQRHPDHPQRQRGRRHDVRPALLPGGLPGHRDGAGARRHGGADWFLLPDQPTRRRHRCLHDDRRQQRGSPGPPPIRPPRDPLSAPEQRDVSILLSGAGRTDGERMDTGRPGSKRFGAGDHRLAPCERPTPTTSSSSTTGTICCCPTSRCCATSAV